MKVLFTACIALCLAGVAYAAKGDDCSGSNPCDNDLQCQEDTCRVKIGVPCTGGSTNECPTSAGDCPSGNTPVCKCPAEKVKSDDDEFKCLLKESQLCQTDDQCITNTKCTGNVGSTTCSCESEYMVNNDKTKCLAKESTTCQANADCFTGMVCTGTEGAKTCSCKTGYTVSDDKITCKANLGTTCDETEDCPANGMCNSGKKCECKTNYVANSAKTMCQKAPGQDCSAGECGENSVCDTTCKCKDNFFSKDNGRCGKKVGDDAASTCTAESECVDFAECTGEPKKCKCKKDYSADEGFCSGASAVVSSLLLLLAALVMPRWM